MSKRRHRRRICIVICGHVHGLHRGNRSLFRTGNALLEGTHLSSKRWLITDGRWNAAKKCGYFATCLCKTENIINKQKYVLSLFIAEIFGHSETGKSNTESGSWRFIHLTENKRCFIYDA